ncbi:MAG TPA: hypothetical protein P5567_13785 [Kiritimatiellia bacterium]|nr:hypothetical protein [Kiritimatiellia bacterium]HRZ13512.1 hypothetical protein [Kiritimatiellia bacterium]HSA19183.1 hypothetical protein [Kiritimatiellia bacterium]
MKRRAVQWAAVALAGLLESAGAATVRWPIATDTYLDSRTENQTLNYGAANTLKALINNNVTGDGSVCRALFTLPAELWNYSPTSLVSVTAWFYVWQDNTGDRHVTLFPLARTFVEGTQNGGAADGATWLTYDGAHAWLQAGGDFLTNFPAAGVKEEILDEGMHDRFFSFDLMPLLTNETAREALRQNGALLRIDEQPIPTNGLPRAPFTSSDDPGYTAEYKPHLRVEVAPPEPEIGGPTMNGGTVTLPIGQLTPGITNTVERSYDLAAANWTSIAVFVTGGNATNWSLPLSPSNRVFYRVTTR